MKKLICLLTVFVSLFFMQVPVKASGIFLNQKQPHN